VNGPTPVKRGKSRPLPEPWTGITGPDCHLCSWSWRGGVREVKVRSAACHVHAVYRAVPGDEAGKNED
jgi:hypothetical protein